MTLQHLADNIRALRNQVATERDAAPSGEKTDLRYVARHMERAEIELKKAVERIAENVTFGISDFEASPRPCPFCGSSAHVTRKAQGSRVECEKRNAGCPVNMRTHHHVEQSSAVSAWNTRA